MSPDGEYLTALVRTEKNPGGTNLMVMNLATGKSEAITGYDVADIVWYYWAGKNRIVFMLARDDDDQFRQSFVVGIFSISPDGKKFRHLYGTGLAAIKYQLEELDSLPNDDNHILVQRRGKDRMFPNVYRLNIKNGKLKKITQNENDVLSWIADNNGVVRVGISSGSDTEDLNYELVYRSDSKSSWKRLFEFYGETFMVFGFDETNSRLFVAARLAGGRYKLYAMDPETGQLGEPILEDPVYDIYYEYSNTPHLVTTDEGKPVYFEYMRDRPRRIFFDANWQMRQKTIDKALPDTENRMVSWDRDEKRFLIFSYSDRDEGSYYLYDEKEKSVRFLIAISPWLDSENLANTEPFEYEARDGLKLYGNITRKTDIPDEPAPTIIMPHGGPYGVRDQWGFDKEVQYLASLGYTVIQPNFRGSGGYGYKVRISGYRQLGLQMQDDVTDVTHWAIENGIADPQRICIYGVGFGAYAALMGVAKKPGLYACAIGSAGVYDLELVARKYSQTGGRKGFGQFKAWGDEVFGNFKKHAERLRATSPVTLVPQIQAPVLIIHGLEGSWNSIHSDIMITGQLKRHDKRYQHLELQYGGVGFLTEQNEIDRYTVIGEFLGAYLDDEH
ncbi:MAG: prolyl oligopeptidase family serine peptidase [Gammaproteobacteria bacterium]|nr:prolyl oligopeptidase family serine peptidase [Gammaproteobacteria bacterium]